MLKQKFVLLYTALLVAATLGIVLLALQSMRAQAESGIPDTPEVKEIIATMENAYRILAIAGQTFDVSGFSSVFVDTPDYKLTEQQRAFIGNILGEDAAKNAGYLTAMRAKYIALGRDARLLQATLEKARAEHRNLTSEELQEILRANHGVIPTMGSPITQPAVLSFKSIEIHGDRAIVRYDSGAALLEAILIRINGKWFIAGITPIWIHF